MAIAFDAGTHSAGTTGTSKTYSHTTGSLSNGIIVVGASDGDSSADTLSAFQYAGVNMTRQVYNPFAAFACNAYLYFLVAPASGANNVTFNCSASHSLRSACATYSGAAQTGQMDGDFGEDWPSASGTTVSLTAGSTTVDNSWPVCYVQFGDSLTASAGTTFRGSGTGSAHQYMDKNAAKTPAGAFTFDFTVLSATDGVAAISAIEPAAASAGFLLLLGVGV